MASVEPDQQPPHIAALVAFEAAASEIADKRHIDRLTKWDMMRVSLASFGICYVGIFHSVSSVYTPVALAWLSSLLLLPKSIRVQHLRKISEIVDNLCPRLSSAQLGYERLLRYESMLKDHAAVPTDIFSSDAKVVADIHAQFVRGSKFDSAAYASYIESIPARFVKYLSQKGLIFCNEPLPDVMIMSMPFKAHKGKDDEKDSKLGSSDYMRTYGGCVIEGHSVFPLPTELLLTLKGVDEIDNQTTLNQTVLLKASEWDLHTSLVCSRKLALCINTLWSLIHALTKVHWYADDAKEDKTNRSPKAKQPVAIHACVIPYAYAVSRKEVAYSIATISGILEKGGLATVTGVFDTTKIPIPVSTYLLLLTKMLDSTWTFRDEAKVTKGTTSSNFHGRLAACASALRCVSVAICYGMEIEIRDYYAILKSTTRFEILPYPWTTNPVKSAPVSVLNEILVGLGTRLEPVKMTSITLGLDNGMSEIETVLHVHNLIMNSGLSEDDKKAIRISANSLLPARYAGGMSELKGDPHNLPIFTELGKMGPLPLLGLAKLPRPKEKPVEWGTTIYLPKVGPVEALPELKRASSYPINGTVCNAYLSQQQSEELILLGFRTKLEKIPQKRYIALDNDVIVDNAAVYMEKLEQGYGKMYRVLAPSSRGVVDREMSPERENRSSSSVSSVKRRFEADFDV